MATGALVQGVRKIIKNQYNVTEYHPELIVFHTFYKMEFITLRYVKIVTKCNNYT